MGLVLINTVDRSLPRVSLIGRLVLPAKLGVPA